LRQNDICKILKGLLQQQHQVNLPPEPVGSYQKLRGDDKNGKQLSFRYEFFEASPTV